LSDPISYLAELNNKLLRNDQYSELDPNATLEVLKKEAQKGVIEIDNTQIRPTPLGIELCKLDKSKYM